MELNKKFGLIIPQKKRPNAPGPASLSALANQVRPSIFSSNDDDKTEGEKRNSGDRVASGSKPSSYRHEEIEAVKRKALEQDPQVFDYDASYDSVQERRRQQRHVESCGPESKKPKYIENLLKKAAEKKLEDERAIERKVQKERELEGDQFKDKEQFMTAGYRRKLEELRQQEEEEKKRLTVEEDVTKKSDLTDFYRNILNDTFDRERK